MSMYCIHVVLLMFKLQLFVGMAATQPNKPTMRRGDDSDEEGERPGWLEVGLRKVREQDAAELARKKKEDEEVERAWKQKAREDYHTYQWHEKRKYDALVKQRQKDFEERTKKLWALEAANKVREDKIFRDRMLYEASLAREKEEEEDVTSKKNGKGP